MKKIVLGYFLVSIIGGVAALGLWHAFERKEHHVNGPLSDEIRFQKASYRESLPVNGPDFVEAASKTVHAVVHIKTEYQQKSTVYDFFFRDFWGDYGNSSRPYVAAGSGVIISADGYIVTNNHVVQDADYIEVTLNDKRSFKAEIVSTDPSTDIALVKVEEKDLPFLTFGNSDNVSVGEWVLAVGNPFNLTSTVTAGIVSAKARNINILGKEGSIESFIQTDAAVNPGNSGGALVNTSGELIGINAAIASNTGSFTGYSFAIPSNLVKKIIEDFISFGTVQRGYIGVTPVDITSDFARENNLNDIRGVYIYSVQEKGSAGEAGMEKGDVITRVNNIPVNSVSEMLEIIGQHRPGEKVPVTWLHDGKEVTRDLMLRNKDGSTGIIKKEETDVLAELGAEFKPINTEEKRWLKIEFGVKVTNLGKGLLANAGIRNNFIITSIDKTPIRNEEDIRKAIRNKRGGVLVEGYYPNRGKAYYLMLLKER